MKKILIPAFALLAASTAGAADEKFSVAAEYLSLTPSGGDGSYVLVSPATSPVPTGEIKTNRLADEPGYRLDMSYALSSGQDVFVRVMDMQARQVENTAGSFLWATSGRSDFTGNFENYTGTAKSDRRIGVSLSEVGLRRAIGGEQAGLSLSYALQYAEINQSQRIAYTSATNDGLQERSSSFYGVGPSVTLKFAQPLVQTGPINVLLDMSASAGLLAGKARVKETQTLNANVSQDVTKQVDNQVTPNFGARLGVAAETDILGLASTFALGYELSGYTGVIHQAVNPDDVADGQFLTEERDLGLQGYYASVKFSF